MRSKVLQQCLPKIQLLYPRTADLAPEGLSPVLLRERGLVVSRQVRRRLVELKAEAKRLAQPSS